MILITDTKVQLTKLARGFVEFLKAQIYQMRARPAVPVLIVAGICAIIGLSIALFFDRTVSFDEPRYGIVTARGGLYLRTAPSENSEKILLFPIGSVLKVTGETLKEAAVPGDGAARWYRVLTGTGRKGWSYGKYVSFLSREQGERELRRQSAALELRLRKLIKQAVARHISAARLYNLASVRGTVIVTPLKASSESLYVVHTASHLKGDLIGLNEYQVDCAVRVSLELAEGRLDKSDVRVQEVEVTGQKQVSGFSERDAAQLLVAVLQALKSQ